MTDEEPTRQQPELRDDARGGGLEPRRLFRSRENRILAGVAGGLARYFAIDPIIVRIAFAALAVFGGVGVFLAREREVLQHIARGYLYKEIGVRLGISAKTVEAHVSAVLRKLQLSNRHELSAWAVERRLVG